MIVYDGKIMVFDISGSEDESKTRARYLPGKGYINSATHQVLFYVLNL